MTAACPVMAGIGMPLAALIAVYDGFALLSVAEK
jgi:hypothetical protein